MTKRILLIESSPMSANSLSTQALNKVAARLEKTYPGAEVVRRNVNENALPHLSAQTIAAFYTPLPQHTPEIKAKLELSDQLIGELTGADIVVIGAPMWNFGIPSQLKAWVDHVVRVGRTFAYGPTGPKGLLTNKKLIVVVASGGVYSSGPAAPMNFVDTNLRSVFGFIGVTDIQAVHVEGIAIPDNRAAAIATADAAIAALAL